MMKYRVNQLLVLSTTLFCVYLISPWLFTPWLVVFPVFQNGIEHLGHQYGSSHWIAIIAFFFIWKILSSRNYRVEAKWAWKWICIWIFSSLLVTELIYLCLVLLDSRTWMDTDAQPFSSTHQFYISKTYVIPWNMLLGHLGVWLSFADKGSLGISFDISDGRVNPLGIQFEQWLLTLIWFLVTAFLIFLTVKLTNKRQMTLVIAKHQKPLLTTQVASATLLFMAYYFSKANEDMVDVTDINNIIIDFFRSVLMSLIATVILSWLILGFMNRVLTYLDESGNRPTRLPAP